MRDLLVIVVYFGASQYQKHYDRRNKQEQQVLMYTLIFENRF